jgi:hypothetical protein
MIASRTVARGARALRTAPLRANIRHIRFESSSTTSQAAKTGGSSGLVGGIAGGALVFAVSDPKHNWPSSKLTISYRLVTDTII